MKKKLWIIIMIALVTLVALFFFGNRRPDGISKGAYTLGKQAVSIADQYLDFSLSKEESTKQLEAVYSRFKGLAEEDVYDSIVSMYVSLLNLSLVSSGSLGDFNDSDVLESRNNLASQLGLKERSK